jgi:hypothetical protein
MALDMFSDNPQLGILSLESNNINAIEPANDQLTVKQLFLQDNNLTEISGLGSVNQLAILDLSENPNILLEEETFDSVPCLVELGLNNVSFINVKSIERLIVPLSQVKRIKLARNRLSPRQLRKFFGLKHLSELIQDQIESRNSSLDTTINENQFVINRVKQLENSDSVPESLKLVLNSLKTKIVNETYVRKKFKHCPKISCPTKKTSIILLIIGLTLTVIVIVCTAIGLVYFCQTKYKNLNLPWFLANSYTTRDLPEPEIVFVEANLIYDWNTTEIQSSNNEETEEPG